jgi:vancomycin resistance protein YoaR
MLKAGFEATERYCHAKPVTYVPMGLDATVAYGYLDLRMTNPGDAPCLVRATAKGGRLTAEVFGMPLPDLRIEIESKVLKEFPPDAGVQAPVVEGAVAPKLRSGFLVETVRKWVRGGLLERVERLDTSMYPAEKPKTR